MICYKVFETLRRFKSNFIMEYALHPARSLSDDCLRATRYLNTKLFGTDQKQQTINKAFADLRQFRGKINVNIDLDQLRGRGGHT